MIVPLKKIAVIVQAKEAKHAIEELRKLGSVHVEHQQVPKGENVNAIRENISIIDEASAILSQGAQAGASPAQTGEKSHGWKDTCRHIIDFNKRYEQLEEYSRATVNNIAQWEPWGDFDPEEINNLAKKNIFIKLYQVPQKELQNLPQELIVKKISTVSGLVNCAVVSRENIDLAFKEVTPPKIGLKKMQERLSIDKIVMQQIKNELKKLCPCLENFKLIKKDLEKQLEFYEALSGMGEEKSLVYLAGYMPYDAEGMLKNTARENKWGILVQDPKDEDNVPTLIRNPRWVSVISPLFKLLELIPGYTELDISVLFLLFFSLFFGMIIGDAGYGAIYLILTLWFEKKIGKRTEDKRIFALLYILSTCAIFWGIITGTVFGQEWYAKAGFKPLIPVLNNTKFLQAFCFFIGAFHLTLAHIWRAVLKLPALSALADIGWICVLWAGFFLAKTLILDDPFPIFGKWLVICGVTLVIFFTSPQRNILKAVGEGLGNVALSLMNNFTDVVSYIRLFAVGLAGVAIADTVNTLAAAAGEGNFIGKLVILFIGHTLNVILGPMSVLVHGVRLNVLEFSGHVGVGWSGVAYKPLKEK